MKDACFYDRMSGFMNFKGAHLYFLFLNYMGYSQIWQKIIVWGIMMPFKILWDITIFIIFHLSASGAWFIYGCNLEIKVLPLWQQRYTFASRGSCSLPLAKITNVLISVSELQGGVSTGGSQVWSWPTWAAREEPGSLGWAGISTCSSTHGSGQSVCSVCWDLNEGIVSRDLVWATKGFKPLIDSGNLFSCD